MVVYFVRLFVKVIGKITYYDIMATMTTPQWSW